MTHHARRRAAHRHEGQRRRWRQSPSAGPVRGYDPHAAQADSPAGRRGRDCDTCSLTPGAAASDHRSDDTAVSVPVSGSPITVETLKFEREGLRVRLA